MPVSRSGVSGVNGTVRRIATAYEVRGMVAQVTSFDNATVGSGSVVNDVLLTYDNFGHLTADYQSHAGAVNTSTTPACLYAFADGTANTTRLTNLTYPNGRVLAYNYGASGGVGDAASRVASLIDNDGTTHLADYSYLGLGASVAASLSQPGLTYTLVGTAGGIDPDTGDVYRGLDRFGRVKDLLWVNSGSLATVQEVKHGYDRAGNRLWRADPADPADEHDELYGYDGLYRLKSFRRGGLNMVMTAITMLQLAECWGLDATGNWADFRQDANGDGSWDLVQSRSANPVNEITALNSSVGPAWASPAYDAAGNMTTMPQPGAPTASYSATYDAWNRLVKLVDGSNTVAAYQYDGLKRRTVKQTYSAGVLSETRHFFYSSSWQVLEERVGTATTAERQFVWGVRYVDDLVLRDRDATGGGTLNERLYAMQDANWNVTALADTTGAVQERYAYDAYGSPMVLTATFGVRTESRYVWEVRFAGYRWDAECGLYQARHRAYLPVFGCWLERDPLGLGAGDANRYRLLLNNPVSAADPLGLAWVNTTTPPTTLVATCEIIERFTWIPATKGRRKHRRTTRTGPYCDFECRCPVHRLYPAIHWNPADDWRPMLFHNRPCDSVPVPRCIEQIWQDSPEPPPNPVVLVLIVAGVVLLCVPGGQKVGVGLVTAGLLIMLKDDGGAQASPPAGPDPDIIMLTDPNASSSNVG